MGGEGVVWGSRVGRGLRVLSEFGERLKDEGRCPRQVGVCLWAERGVLIVLGRDLRLFGPWEVAGEVEGRAVMLTPGAECVAQRRVQRFAQKLTTIAATLESGHTEGFIRPTRLRQVLFDWRGAGVILASLRGQSRIEPKDC